MTNEQEKALNQMRRIILTRMSYKPIDNLLRITEESLDEALIEIINEVEF